MALCTYSEDLKTFVETQVTKQTSLIQLFLPCRIRTAEVVLRLKRFNLFFCSISAICIPTCKNGGVCDRPGHCNCQSGFDGDRCDGCMYLAWDKTFFSNLSRHFFNLYFIGYSLQTIMTRIAVITKIKILSFALLHQEIQFILCDAGTHLLRSRYTIQTTLNTSVEDSL